ncbi:MAG: hypothetical protein P8J59_07040 [Phycisphaerales bacterium]|nr:hypothetical protein [Phycisphaerales bacterium]
MTLISLSSNATIALSRTRRVLLALVMASIPVGGFAASPVEARAALGDDAHAAAGFAPEDAVAIVRIRAGTVGRDRWSAVILDAIGMGSVDILRNWNAAARITRELVDPDSESIHAVDSSGGNWLHAVRWNDPRSLERRMQRLGPRPLGRGRFRFVDSSIELVIAGPWLVLAPVGSAWLDQAMERARVDDFGSRGNREEIRIDDLPSAPIEVLLRHAPPTGGETLVSLSPEGPSKASVELAGRYAASPLPSRPRGQFAARLIPSLQGRVALAVLESGVGVLDPTLIRMSADLPAIMPAGEVRQVLSGRRLLVLDGETIRIPRVGLVDVPAVCVAIPCRDAVGSETVTAMVHEQAIHAWLTDAGLAIQAGFASPTEEISSPPTPAEVHPSIEIARDGIRHLEFGPDFVASMGGHPASMAASLNWTIRRIGDEGAEDVKRSSMSGAWMLVGSSPRIVRRVGDAIQRSEAVELEQPICMQGVASPARLGLQFADLAVLRADGGDQDAPADAKVLERLSRLLRRLDRVEWSTSLQTDDAVRGSGRITLIPDSVDPRVRPSGGRRVEDEGSKP